MAKNNSVNLDKILHNLRESMDSCQENIAFFKEVKEHILCGMSKDARGIVWEYSPYMTALDCDKIIEMLKAADEDYKELYAKLVALDIATDLNSDLLKIEDFCFNDTFNEVFKNIVSQQSALFNRAVDLREKSEEADDRKSKIEQLMNKYRSGGK